MTKPNPMTRIQRLDEVLANPKLMLSPRLTLADTTVEVLGALNIKAYAATYMATDKYGVEEQFAVVVSVLEDLVGRTTIRPTEEHRWTLVPESRSDRISAVRSCVQGAVLNTASIRTILTNPQHNDRNRAVQHLTVLAWWRARLDEGHTPATARLMLSLTVPPDLLRALAFTADGTPTFDPITLGQSHVLHV